MAALIVGISGVTCGGKTLLATKVKKLIPNAIIIAQDDYCLDLKDPRHIWCKEVSHINFDVITCLDMNRMYKDIQKIIGRRKLLKKEQVVEQNGFENMSIDYLILSINNKIKEQNVLLIILDGYLLYAYEPFLSLIELKYFFTLEIEECLKRRKLRVYDPPDVPGYFEKCVWPEYLKHYEEVKNSVDDITYFNSTVENPLNVLLIDVFNSL